MAFELIAGSYCGAAPVPQTALGAWNFDPFLLLALTALLESIENVNFGVHDDDGQTYDAIPWAQAEAAIAKATEEEK